MGKRGNSTIRERRPLQVGIDTGGTFTDCVYLKDGKIEVLKVFSTPSDPARAVLDALAKIKSEVREQAGRIDVRHGTTLGTNTMLERTGARVAFVTTAGFEDTIAIGRQTRAKLYDWFAPVPVCLVAEELRLGVPERVSAEGVMLQSPSADELATLAEAVRASGAEAVAVSLLFSFAAPATELRVEAALRGLRIPISTSHRILPEFREYERASTTVVNAYLAPKMERYLLHLEDQVAARHEGGRVDVMQSSGGIVPARLASQEPVRTVLSGPAGGAVGACTVARLAGFDRIVGFDVGGTSTDVFLAETASGVRLTRESMVAEVPVSVPMLDIHTAGAGGGSMARFDAGGLLRVGPESAGADPGPICFGRGEVPTVTDANLLLGRLDAGSFLGGSLRLDRERVKRLMERHRGSLASVEDFAAGILRVVEAQMKKAIRVISVSRGHDPRDFTLVAFGGGGPLHACSLARALRMPRVLIPTNPGALSAIGILLADLVRDYSLTVMLRGESMGSIGVKLAELASRGRDEFAAYTGAGADYTMLRSVDVRYLGQGHELNLLYDEGKPLQVIEEFHRLHERLYGFCDVEKQVEIVNLRVRISVAGSRHEPRFAPSVQGDGRGAVYAEMPVYFDGAWLPTPWYRRDGLHSGDDICGPAMITEYTSATVVPAGCQAQVDGYGNLVIAIDEGTV